MEREFIIDFIGIGSGKSGSTWLYNNIVKHPEVCDRNPKEIRFFDLHYGKGLHWYRNQFSGCGNLLKGEFSVQYLSHSETAKRIKKNYPKVKLMAILRKPEERIFSDYLHAIRKADIRPDVPFSEYIKDEKNLKYGLYYEQLLPFFNEFPSAQIKIILLDEVEMDPLKVLREIFVFIGVSNVDFVPDDLHDKVNDAEEYRLMYIENLITNTSKYLNNAGYTLLVERLKKLGLPSFVRKLNTIGKSKNKMHVDSRTILKKAFAPSNRELARLINKDLSLWE